MNQQSPQQPQVPHMVLTKPSFNEYRPIAILVPQSKLGLIEGTTLEMSEELRIKDRVMLSREGSREETPQNLTPNL